MAELHELLVWGTSHFGGVESSPTPVILLTSQKKFYFIYFEHLHIVSSTIIHAIDNKTYRQDGRVVLGGGLRDVSLRWRGFESHSWNFVDVAIQSIVSYILNICKLYLLP